MRPTRSGVSVTTPKLIISNTSIKCFITPILQIFTKANNFLMPQQHYVFRVSGQIPRLGGGSIPADTFAVKFHLLKYNVLYFSYLFSNI